MAEDEKIHKEREKTQGLCISSSSSDDESKWLSKLNIDGPID